MPIQVTMCGCTDLFHPRAIVVIAPRIFAACGILYTDEFSLKGELYGS
jgi:hypothetical protein